MNRDRLRTSTAISTGPVKVVLARSGSDRILRQDSPAKFGRPRKGWQTNVSPRPSAAGGSSADIARQAAAFKRHADPQGLVEEVRRPVAGVADALAEGYPNLARLLRAPTPAGPPLLAAAFCYFFRREVETDDELAHGLFFDGLRQLSASQARAFGEVGKAPAALGGQFDAVFEQLDRVEAAVAETRAAAVETRGAAPDLQAELRRLAARAHSRHDINLRLRDVSPVLDIVAYADIRFVDKTNPQYSGGSDLSYDFNSLQEEGLLSPTAVVARIGAGSTFGRGRAGRCQDGRRHGTCARGRTSRGDSPPGFSGVVLIGLHGSPEDGEIVSCYFDRNNVGMLKRLDDKDDPPIIGECRGAKEIEEPSSGRKTTVLLTQCSIPPK